LNVFNAFFTPAFKASIPQIVKTKEDFAPAITLSNATYQLLAIMGPGLAGVAAAWLGTRDIFFADAFTFLLSALFVLAVSRQMFMVIEVQKVEPVISKWQEVFTGTKLLFSDVIIRFALFIELAVAIVGANVLVNTVGYVKGTLEQGNKEYGWVMSALGIGAVVGAFGSALIDRSPSRKRSLIIGAFIICLAVVPANQVSLFPLIGLWALAGLGQNLAEMPSQMLIAERIPLEQQGRVYGAHFAWSHLWWAIGYPVAGFLGSYFKDQSFLVAGGLGLGVLILVLITHLISKNKK
jgi:MFS transporter, NRE family, putaive nickel resistance protein